MKMNSNQRRVFAVFSAMILLLTVSATAFAVDDPIQVVNNLSDFIFSLSVKEFMIANPIPPLSPVLSVV